MQNTLIIFGGRSAEHEVSIRSARNIIASLDKKLFKPIIVVISRTGNWYLLNGNTIPNSMSEVDDKLSGGALCSLMRQPSGTVLITESGKAHKIDIAFPVLHGPMGEDGTIQGMFEMMLLPYVGSGVLASSLGMDKEALKHRLQHYNIPIVPFVTLWYNAIVPSFKDICTKFKSNILFVKPALMGSSIGIAKVSTEAEFRKAIERAFKYSFKILVEQSIKGREFECSVLGNRNPIASCVGEVKPNHDFYSYEAKYLDPNGADIIIPAEDISAKITEEIRDISIKAFKATECMGLARVDFFVSTDNKVYVNELNTIPGFTSISMYPKMWEQSGIKYTDLITKLLQLAREEFVAKQALSLTPEELLYK